MNGLLSAFILLCLLCGVVKRVKLFDAFTSGAREGLETAVRILPPLLGMMCMIAAVRESGLTDVLKNLLGPAFEAIGLPRGVIPLFILRPLSGSASLAMVKDIISNYGVDSPEGVTACALMGSSETLVYVLAVYLGGTEAKKTRHLIPAALLSWLAGGLASGLAVWLFSL